MNRFLSRAATAGLVWAWAPLAAQMPSGWKAHDPARPQPPVVAPGSYVGFARPPGDAIVLFDGTDLSQWRSTNGGAAGWKVTGDAMETVPGQGPLRTARGFGDVQLHIEWASPSEVAGSGQGRGNSGVYLMGLYEIQVLDSHGNTTYPDGQAGAVYGQYPPRVNASAPPGEWQSFDVVFRRPRFAADGRLLAPARMTVFHNGVLVQDAVELFGPTDWLHHRPYEPHPSRLPLELQDHDNPVRFRNVWLRELDEGEEAGPPSDRRPVVALDAQQAAAYSGLFRDGERTVGRVFFDDGHLWIDLFGWGRVLRLVAHTATEFSFPRTAGEVRFELDEGSRATALALSFAGIDARGERSDP